MAVQNNVGVDESVVESPPPVSAGIQEQDGKKTKFPGFNLYVKNLDDSFNDKTLRDAFDAYGTITSAKVMCDASGKSKGFGFVCFTTQDEAHKALSKMNGRIVGTKPLYVAMAQKKEERKQYLSDKYKNFNFSPTGPTASHHQTAAAQKTPEQTSARHAPNGFPNNTMVQYAYLPGEGMLQGTVPGTYIVPPNPGMSYVPVPYQPVFLVPGVNVMPPPPQQMPVLHQPIYIHSSKTNTLIYSTSVQSIPQASSPSGFPTISDGHMVGKSLQVTHRRNEAPSPKMLNSLEPAADSSTVIFSSTNSELSPSYPMPSPPAQSTGFPSNTHFTT